MCKNRRAFTLAETLTTLMIIGVVATMTIPTLISGVDDQKTTTMLKKLYSSMNVNIQTVLSGADSVDQTIDTTKEASTSALARSKDTYIYSSVEDMSSLRAWGKDDSGKHNGVLANKNFINIDYECTNCFSEAGSILPNPMTPSKEATAEVKDAAGNVVTPAEPATNANFSAYRLNNGAWFAIHDFKGNCKTIDYVSTSQIDDVKTEEDEIAYANNDKKVYLCGILVFDTNGQQGPNTPGRDRFAYYISDKAVDNSYLIPMGYRATDKDNKSQYNKSGYITSTVGETNDCDPGTVAGYNCTAQMMMNNWKLPR